MKEEWISQFIDDELTLDEKIAFVGTVHEDSPFREECLDLLRQEKRLREPPSRDVPMPALSPRPRRSLLSFRPLQWALVLLVAGVALVLARNLSPPAKEANVPYRFIVYQPGADRVEIAGTFTGWERVSLNRSGNSGYWEIVLSLPPVEHRYTYVIDGERTMSDPTVPGRERDDFGGENSIIPPGGMA
ncbi:MAG TPA: glycogen-binding domain-containing protein [Syntrophales bacterium]|mgnify:FL=1|nr:glycogen-binding domain-containing protein [Syntrophales bacterium]